MPGVRLVASQCSGTFRAEANEPRREEKIVGKTGVQDGKGWEGGMRKEKRERRKKRKGKAWASTWCDLATVKRPAGRR
jgi:hypothetical protein